MDALNESEPAAERRPSALTIAGVDPSGGAGIGADLRAFAAAGVWGASAVAALTVQSTRGVTAVRAVEAALLVAQVEAVLADLRVTAIKTGALGSAENADALCVLLAAFPGIPVIIDPVMIPSRRSEEGARLDGVDSLAASRRLAARAFLLTPNLDEAARLLGVERGALDPEAAAVALLDLGARAVLVKGGHDRGPMSIDRLALRDGPARVVEVAGPRRETAPIHGTGCTLASLIAGRLAARVEDDRLPSMEALIAAVQWARARLDAAILDAQNVGGGQLVLAPSGERSDPGDQR